MMMITIMMISKIIDDVLIKTTEHDTVWIVVAILVIMIITSDGDNHCLRDQCLSSKEQTCQNRSMACLATIMNLPTNPPTHQPTHAKTAITFLPMTRL